MPFAVLHQKGLSVEVVAVALQVVARNPDDHAPDMQTAVTGCAICTNVAINVIKKISGF